jgi:hypothetical protein
MMEEWADDDTVPYDLDTTHEPGDPNAGISGRWKRSVEEVYVAPPPFVHIHAIANIALC